MPAQQKITSSYNIRKGTSHSDSKENSPSKRSLGGEYILF